MTFSNDPNAGLEYRRPPIPTDRPVFLVFRDRFGVFRSVDPYRWDREIWISTRTGAPPGDSIEILGWIDPEDGPA